MPKKTYKCVVSGKPIPKERVEALKMLGLPESKWTCVEHALDVTRKGIYLGENGTSQLLIVDRVYNDSVRSVFRDAEKQVAKSCPVEESAEEPAEQETCSVSYPEKELNYFVSDDEQTDPQEKIQIIKRQNS
jgi:hypothetical protein